MSHDPPLLFVSLGMFIIDTIVDAKGVTMDDIVGGAGTYAALGSRIFAQEGETGFIVDYGDDVPSLVESTIDSLGLCLLVRRDGGRRCTRGLNTYRGHTRHFEYLTPKIRITADQLPPHFLRSKSFHLICSPQRCISLVEELRHLRNNGGGGGEGGVGKRVEGPLIMWEPVPDACTPENKADFAKAVKCVDIVSPNLDECAALFGQSVDGPRGNQADSVVEELAKLVRGMGVGTVIIRCSARGSYIASESQAAWFPASLTNQDKVVDATGAGNTFCGSYVTALAQGLEIEEAMCRATVAAGLSIQQIGLPVLSTDLHGKDLWNGQDASALLDAYRRRIAV